MQKYPQEFTVITNRFIWTVSTDLNRCPPGRGVFHGAADAGVRHIMVTAELTGVPALRLLSGQTLPIASRYAI